MSDSSAKAKFDFIKSPMFRVIHADGVFGGMTPRGSIFLSFFSERFPIPTTIVHEIRSSGELGDEIRSEREGRKSIVREVEVGVQLDLGVAKAFLLWLQQKIEEAEGRKAVQQDEAKENVQQ
ncbi:MAG: hypothetical protein ACREBQ_10140 [Nitrososphaerales archaeon]